MDQQKSNFTTTKEIVMSLLVFVIFTLGIFVYIHFIDTIGHDVQTESNQQRQANIIECKSLLHIAKSHSDSMVALSATEGQSSCHAWLQDTVKQVTPLMIESDE